MSEVNVGKISCIYKIVSPTGRIYIGQTRNFKARIKTYKWRTCKSQQKLYRSLLKYGFDNHTVEIVEYCAESDLGPREDYWIRHFNCVEDGLNLMYGGFFGGVPSQETRDKISRANKGRKKPAIEIEKMMATKKLRFASGALVSWTKGRFGPLSPSYGVRHSKEFVEKRTGAKSACFKGHIVAYKDGMEVGRYGGGRQAAYALGIKHQNIYECLKGRQHTAFGYTFARESLEIVNQ